MVNSTTFDFDRSDSDAVVESFFRQHRYLQNEMVVFLRNVLVKIGKKAGTGFEDGRNQWALNWCKKISEV